MPKPDEQQGNMKTWKIIDREEPNLIEDQFDYNLPPKIQFEGTITEEIDGAKVEFDPNEALKRDLVVTDTSFRDGQQAIPLLYHRTASENVRYDGPPRWSERTDPPVRVFPLHKK